MTEPSETLKKVKDADTAVSAETFHVRLLINKLRRRQLTIAFIAAFCAILVLLAKDYGKHKAWWLTALPVSAVGLVLSLLPPSEQWEYKPWQARPRQYERHQIRG